MELVRSLFEDKSIEGVTGAAEIALEFANTKHDLPTPSVYL